MSQRTSKREILREKQSHKISTPLLLSLAGGLVLIGVVIFAIFGNSPASKADIEIKGAPRLKIDKEKVELGDRKLGSDVEVTLEVTNIGDQPLRFTDKPYVEVLEGC